MEVLDFMNTHENWEELLNQPPYCITVKHDGDYALLKYNQLNSDFNNKIVRECRGAIFYKLPRNVGWICVCRAFDKFGNYGETYVPDIDWDSAVVEEKIDGSLIKLWYHNNNWHVSTNSTINAFMANIDGTIYNFGMLVHEAFGSRERFNEFTNLLDQSCTYMFELVSPKSRVTISYPKTKLYYLGQRNNISMREYKMYTDFMESYGILCPRKYNLNRLNDCLEYVKTMTKDEEGFVIQDKHFNRMKLKSPEYLLAFHMNNNGVITIRRIIEMIKNEQIDDFLAYCPEYKDMVDNVSDGIKVIVNELNSEWNIVKEERHLSKKEYAALISEFKYKDFLFKKYDNSNIKAMDYIMSQTTNKIKDMIERLK